MNIQRFSALTGISAHTIRYYEKIGVLKHVTRNASGHRSFNSKDIDWISFVKRLKDMGMPLDAIKRYADLREKGDVTAQLRKQLLEEHVAVLEEKIELESLHLMKIKEKIIHYEEVIESQLKA
ncbi:MAG: MerR family transcriptional regulator [Marinomonas sp.]|uniref:MerR family transcriptional regulator n=1 Tax=Marinomonas sp. GJ51-6 TaxID=2992802 RepID=UPI00293415C1|nr:MerR family transcriptional regulator [Marinomonas sp. GJ51-6]WOD08477.1 MerR family transcriptional regulator [Marinomonas sp. GJ51-6]